MSHPLSDGKINTVKVFHIFVVTLKKASKKNTSGQLPVLILRSHLCYLCRLNRSYRSHTNTVKLKFQIILSFSGVLTQIYKTYNYLACELKSYC